jgi:hypothetical protein
LFSNFLKSTEGIFILCLIIFFSKISFFHFLIIFNTTFVQFGHFILSTASYKSKSFKLIQFASVKISHFNNQFLFAGDHFKTRSIITHSCVFSTIAHIHSKSQDNISLNFIFSS